ncbi:MAG: ABC transporter substrate-binding protein [Myxococcales bacterium]|nr:ABC transporter substrate-binding protein [Myxococcales bacterium]
MNTTSKVSLIAASFFLYNSASGQDPAAGSTAFTADAASTLIRSTVDRAVEVLKDPALQGREQRVERHSKLRKISDEVFDWDEMARRSIGVHWRDLNDAQRKRFVGTFKELLASHYLSQMDRFQGEEQVQHIGTEKNSEGFVVKTKLVTPSRAWVPIDFFVNTQREVYDVAIEGVSLSNHYRGSFSRMLVNATFDEMMTRLERKLDVQRRVAEQRGAEGAPKAETAPRSVEDG